MVFQGACCCKSLIPTAAALLCSLGDSWTIKWSQVPSVSHPKSRQPRPSYPPLENRKCPVPGCDSQVSTMNWDDNEDAADEGCDWWKLRALSSFCNQIWQEFNEDEGDWWKWLAGSFQPFLLQGHLSGKLERHFTHDACPTFHNTTAKVDTAMIRIIKWLWSCRLVETWWKSGTEETLPEEKLSLSFRPSHQCPMLAGLSKRVVTRSIFYIFPSLQWAEGLPGEDEAGAVGEGGADESRRRRRHSCHREGDESQGDHFSFCNFGINELLWFWRSCESDFPRKMLKLIVLGSHIKLGPGYVQRSPSKGQQGELFDQPT